MVKVYGGFVSFYFKKLCFFCYVSWMDYCWLEGVYLVVLVIRLIGSILGCMKGWGKVIVIFIFVDVENIVKGWKVVMLKDVEYGCVLIDWVWWLCIGLLIVVEWRMM